VNSIIINLDDNADMNTVYNKIRELYPDFKIVKKQNLKKKVTWEEIEELCGIVCSDIDEKAELEDCLQEECAKEFYADYIITRNIKDFINSSIEAIEPHEFLKRHENRRN